jgi:hypothetical protein
MNFRRGRRPRQPWIDYWRRSASDMTAFQQGMRLALGLDLLKAVLGYDLVDEVVVTFQHGKIVF